jgi:glycosidase
MSDSGFEGTGGLGPGGTRDSTDQPFDGVAQKKVIYQLVVRLFGNTHEARVQDGTLEQNGVGRFADVNEAAIAEIKALGCTDVWLTGVLRQATMTDYSSIGLPPDDPDVVKGRAGSFFAVRDYFDVCPDYAVDPADRMAEFEALVARLHAAGLRVLIDLVPNHVARGYGSVVRPELDFGAHDDPSVFFSPQNDFFYLPGGEPLTLCRPSGWRPTGVAFDGRFAREDGGPGRTPRVTGNNVRSARPSATDWYETVKLNYGFNFAEPSASSYHPPPSTWKKVDAILAYWQDKGVDGFRVDFAHWVPPEAWSTILTAAKARRPETWFVAEAYEDLERLLEAGFDAVYFDELTDALKGLYIGASTLESVDVLLRSIDDPVRGRYLTYLENHDERRIASPIVRDRGPDATGLGSTQAGRQLLPLLYLYSNGPVLLLNGQEVGEPGAGAEGFGGDDGRTTIFDYWSMPAFVGWVSGHAYDGAGLTAPQRALRAYHGDLLRLLQAPEVRGNRIWGLRYLNDPRVHPGANAAIFPFARFARGGGSLLVVVANFAVGTPSSGAIRLPADLLDAAGLPSGDVSISLVFDDGGTVSQSLGAYERASLGSAGFQVEVPNQSARVYRVGGR